MNTILSFSCFLTIFFLTLSIHSPPSTAEQQDCARYVCNSDFEYINTTQPQHMGPPLVSQGGRIGLLFTGNGYDYDTSECPRQAVSLSQYDLGDSLFFTPTVPTENGLLPIATPFSISISDEERECEETGVMQMKRRDKEIGMNFWHIAADGDFNTSASCFQFLSFPNPTDSKNTPSYKLQNCPYKCGRGTIGYCQDIGNKTVDSYQYLTSGGYPFEFSILGDISDI